MNVCFISNNDITGGNSGSAMFNAKGELLGLAFDGNWEAMSSDILYEPKMQRTIGVDVRYILFMIEKYGKAGDLIQELKKLPILNVCPLPILLSVIFSKSLHGYGHRMPRVLPLPPSPMAMTICL